MKASLASARQQNEVLSAQRREADAKLNQAKAALEGARADLDKTVVKAPIDGAILKVNVRLGEYAQAGVLSNPLMNMGSIKPLHVRVDIDEADSWRVHKDSPAVASLRGNPAISVALSFVRFEPYVLPKRSLTGDTAERVDTRVLQAIYAFAASDFPAFVGQQVDVFIKAPVRAEAAHNPASGRIAFGAFDSGQMRTDSGAKASGPRTHARLPHHAKPLTEPAFPPAQSILSLPYVMQEPVCHSLGHVCAVMKSSLRSPMRCASDVHGLDSCNVEAPPSQP